MKSRTFAAIAMITLFTAIPASGKNMFWSDEFIIGQFNKYNDIQVHVTGVKQRYKVLQTLEVDLQKGAPQYGGYRGLTDVLQVMSRQAEALGAHAIIRFKYVDVPMSLLSWGSISGTGVAIRYHGRPPAKKKPKVDPRARRNLSDPDGGR